MEKGWDKTQGAGLRVRGGVDVLESWMEGSGLVFSLGLDLRHNPLEVLRWHQAKYPRGQGAVVPEQAWGCSEEPTPGSREDSMVPAGPALGLRLAEGGL